METQDKYIEIVYISEEESENAFFHLESSEEALVEYLKEHDNHDFGQNENDDVYSYHQLPIGKEDTTLEDGYYLIAYNSRLGYFSLYKKVNEPETII